MGAAIAGAIVGKGIDAGVSHYNSQLAWRRTKRMMKNRHQWEVQDLRAAGLNPILSAGAAPSMGSAPAPQSTNFGGAMDQVLKAKMDKASRKNLTSQRSQIAAGIDKTRSDILVNDQAIRKSNADQALTEGQLKHVNTANTLAMLQIPGESLKASIAGSASGQMAAQSGVWMPHLQTLIQGLGAIGIGRMAFGGRAGAYPDKKMISGDAIKEQARQARMRAHQTSKHR